MGTAIRAPGPCSPTAGHASSILTAHSMKMPSHAADDGRNYSSIPLPFSVLPVPATSFDLFSAIQAPVRLRSTFKQRSCQHVADTGHVPGTRPRAMETLTPSLPSGGRQEVQGSEGFLCVRHSATSFPVTLERRRWVP